jgi:hypothetical protein
LSTTSRRVPRRSVLRYVLIALAIAIGVANVINQQSVAADDEPDPAPGSALEALARLEVEGPGPDTGNERELFGPEWADIDGNGCHTRIICSPRRDAYVPIAADMGEHSRQLDATVRATSATNVRARLARPGGAGRRL